MGKGIDQAREDAPEHAALLDDLKDQLLIVFLKRLGGKAIIGVSEVDNTGDDLLDFHLDQTTKTFYFMVKRKH